MCVIVEFEIVNRVNSQADSEALRDGEHVGPLGGAGLSVHAEVGRAHDCVRGGVVGGEFAVYEVGVVGAAALLVEHESCGVARDSVAASLAVVFIDDVIGTAGLGSVDVHVADGLAEPGDLHILRRAGVYYWFHRRKEDSSV